MSGKCTDWAIGMLCIGVVMSGMVGAAMARSAKPGETVSLSLGWQHHLTRQNIAVRITPASGVPITYEAAHPSIRGVVNWYPDPVSRLSVGTQTQQDLQVEAEVYGEMLADGVTKHEQDWWDTTVFLALPPTLTGGPSLITVSGPQGLITHEPIEVDIVAGLGTQTDPLAHLLPTDQTIPGSFVATMERAEHATVTFAGSAVPHCIQLDLFRDAGIGTPWVINPRGDLKNVTWGDDGGKLRVLLTPPNGQTPNHLSHFKFYVAGGVTGLQIAELKAYDQNGQAIADLVAQVTGSDH